MTTMDADESAAVAGGIAFTPDTVAAPTDSLIRDLGYDSLSLIDRSIAGPTRHGSDPVPRPFTAGAMTRGRAR
jgi:hypothetical protein